MVRYEDWDDTKCGIVSRREFDKMHILVAPHGMIATCAVTAGRTHDSPVFREMHGRTPQGSGHHTILDAAYICKANCRAIAHSRRRLVICPRSNSLQRGCTRWARCSSGASATATGLRGSTTNETGRDCVLCHKERFGAVARAKTFRVRQLQLTLKCICYNLIA